MPGVVLMHKTKQIFYHITGFQYMRHFDFVLIAIYSISKSRLYETLSL